MNAPAKIGAAINPIREFLPDIGEEEYGQRAKLRSYRDAATGMIAVTSCGTARQLAWIVVEYATPVLLAPAPLDALDALNRLCSRLLKTAMTAEQFDDLLWSAGSEPADADDLLREVGHEG